MYFVVWLVPKVPVAPSPLDGAAIPNDFFIMYETTSGYRVLYWNTYLAKRELGIGTFRLSSDAGEMTVSGLFLRRYPAPKAKVTFSFRVLTNDGVRQLVEVALLPAVLAAWGASAGARRIMRLQPT